MIKIGDSIIGFAAAALGVSALFQTISSRAQDNAPDLQINLDNQGLPILTWRGESEFSFNLEWTSTLNPSTWAGLPAGALALSTNGANIEARDLRTGLPQRFYRLSGRPNSSPGNLPAYATGQPILADLWVDSANGNDDNNGATRSQAFRTLQAAWRSIPEGTLTQTGYRIRLAPANYPGPYLEDRHGTYSYPIVIEPADGPGTVNFVTVGQEGGNLTVFGSSYVYLQDFRIAAAGGDALHFELCDHVLVRRMAISSQRSEGQDETLKVNQCQYVYLEDSDIANAGDNCVDMVGVQHGHVVRNRIHNSQDWGMYLKGGSAYFVIEGNEIYDCGTGGFTAGQGSGFQFMVSPWLHYEAYDLKVINNIIHDTEGAGLGVNGGYNIFMAFNTLYRVGSRSHAIEFVHGRRGCDGNRADLCQPLLDAGGWGLTGEEEQFIPNRNIYFYDNLLFNPPGFKSEFQHFEIRGAVTAPPGSNVPSPARGDENLQIRGNIIWNGPADLPLGVEEPDQGCQDTNPVCFAAQLRRDNAINQFVPQLVNPAAGDFHPVAGGNVAAAGSLAIPDFGWADAPTRPPVPRGELSNRVDHDRAGRGRPTNSPPGAYLP